jgi:hypothetical protein
MTGFFSLFISAEIVPGPERSCARSFPNFSEMQKRRRERPRPEAARFGRKNVHHQDSCG